MPELLSLEAKRGRGKRLDLTDVVCGIIYVLHEGVRWRALPPVFGKWKSIYTRFNRWTRRGAIQVIFDAVAETQSAGALRSLDASHIKVHQDANVARAEEEAVGRTKGGKNTKLHAVVDSNGHAVKLDLTPANLHDSTHADTMSEAVLPGETLVADKAYDSNSFRSSLQAKGCNACIPPRSNRKAPAKYHRGHYKKRHTVENFFQRAKRCRRLGTRYEKTKHMFLSFVTLFAIMDYWLH